MPSSELLLGKDNVTLSYPHPKKRNTWVVILEGEVLICFILGARIWIRYLGFTNSVSICYNTGRAYLSMAPIDLRKKCKLCNKASRPFVFKPF